MSITIEPPSTIDADQLVPVDPERLQRAKKAYTTRFVVAALDQDATGCLLRRAAPQPGDVVLARVVTLGSHLKLESPVSRRQAMFEGDEILVAYGNRYAPDQFLAEVPADLQECHLLAGGGEAGRVLEQHAGMKQATTIQPLGLLSTTEGVVNLRDYVPEDLIPTTITGAAADRPGSGRTSEGSGLGLSIVSAITSGHGGRVVLDSTPGVGSTFTLELPQDRLLGPPSRSGATPVGVGA